MRKKRNVAALGALTVALLGGNIGGAEPDKTSQSAVLFPEKTYRDGEVNSALEKILSKYNIDLNNFSAEYLIEKEPEAIVDALFYGVPLENFSGGDGKVEINWGDLSNPDRYYRAAVYDYFGEETNLMNRNTLRNLRLHLFKEFFKHAREYPLCVEGPSGEKVSIEEVIKYVTENSGKYQESYDASFVSPIKENLRTIAERVLERGSSLPDELSVITCSVQAEVEQGEVETPVEIKRQVNAFLAALHFSGYPKEVRKIWESNAKISKARYNGLAETTYFSGIMSDDLKEVVSRWGKNRKIVYREWPSDEELNKLCRRLNLGERDRNIIIEERDFQRRLETKFAESNITFLYPDTPEEVYRELISQRERNIVVVFKQQAPIGTSPYDFYLLPLIESARRINQIVDENGKSKVGMIVLLSEEYSLDRGSIVDSPFWNMRRLPWGGIQKAVEDIVPRSITPYTLVVGREGKIVEYDRDGKRARAIRTAPMPMEIIEMAGAREGNYN